MKLKVLVESIFSLVHFYQISWIDRSARMGIDPPKVVSPMIIKHTEPVTNLAPTVYPACMDLPQRPSGSRALSKGSTTHELHGDSRVGPALPRTNHLEFPPQSLLPTPSAIMYNNEVQTKIFHRMMRHKPPLRCLFDQLVAVIIALLATRQSSAPSTCSTSQKLNPPIPVLT